MRPSGILKFKGKKASVFDILFLSIIFVFIIITWVISTKVVNDVKTNLETTSFNNTNLNKINNLNTLWDDLLIFIIGGVTLAMWVSAFFIRTTPVFFFISLSILIILLVITPSIANVYENITNTTEFSTTSSVYYPKTTWLIQHYPTFILIISIITLILLFTGANEEVSI